MATTKRKSTANTIAAMDKTWQAESDLRTLIEARKIRSDAARYKAATDLAKQQMTDVAAIAGGSTDNDADD